MKSRHARMAQFRVGRDRNTAIYLLIAAIALCITLA
jgi:hypothetical protein